MKLFVFKMHEEAPYTDGAILIAAESYRRAEELYHELGRKNGRSSSYRNPILRERPEQLRKNYDCPWYLAHTLELKDDSAEEGILLTAYHDG